MGTKATPLPRPSPSELGGGHVHSIVKWAPSPAWGWNSRHRSGVACCTNQAARVQSGVLKGICVPSRSQRWNSFCPPCWGQACGPPGSAGPFLEPQRRGVHVIPQGPGIPGAAPECRLPLTAPSNTGTMSSGACSQALLSPLQLRESWLRPLSGEGCFVPTENLLDSVAPSGTL